LVLSVKVQKAPAHLRGPGCFTKVSYINLWTGQHTQQHMKQHKGHQHEVGAEKSVGKRRC
jgi:hypothetical protein